MWYLRGGIGAKPQRDLCLSPGTYCVGRLGTEIELDDKSVSRKHAKLTFPSSATAVSFVLDGQYWQNPTGSTEPVVSPLCSD